MIIVQLSCWRAYKLNHSVQTRCPGEPSPHLSWIWLLTTRQNTLPCAPIFQILSSVVFNVMLLYQFCYKNCNSCYGCIPSFCMPITILCASFLQRNFPYATSPSTILFPLTLPWTLMHTSHFISNIISQGKLSRPFANIKSKTSKKERKCIIFLHHLPYLNFAVILKFLFKIISIRKYRIILV